MAEFTFFELHFHDADFTANAPFSAAESPDDVEADAVSEYLPGDESDADEGEMWASESDSSGRSPLPALIGLAVVVALVVLARRLLGGESEPVPE